MSLNAPYSAKEWAVWYWDTFDRDDPPSIDVKGDGLVDGLAELWARYLFETVQASGQPGFSSFHLQWKQGQIRIQGDWEGAKRLRNWLFGKNEYSYTGYVDEADRELLKQIAYVHACLFDKEEVTEQILTLAATAQDYTDFVNRLNGLVKPEEFDPRVR